ncbi:trans-sulfuration enzyme family protein [Streptomyces rapamycinicus]|uniref:homocysteine desulfhydrase n=2 Tax=Streptomyces rapamycinicus TaxID=1226757 RepID=A0A3L8R4Y4_STRRN|nr:PLP-dependent transferase [Streptomyces rapamycinicus]MBB4780693.1 methionine-gamma-lyase [Streptomyces rapamycinicus]RLV74656.1 cystathionine gamma-synthase [Streptomyces rapamycinicus NRRL 5491]UTO61401.1 PLP-dependent transferase [Streptomyces rapamycinicus]UTP29348.1 PLP-dependent transferase [Streptomyces rapamycinicus NRRL 5491]
MDIRQSTESTGSTGTIRSTGPAPGAPGPHGDATARHAFATEAVHAGREDLPAMGLHAVPLDLSTTYPSYDSRQEAARIDAFAATGARPDGPPVYARLDNPTVARFETALARLEGTESAVAFASGMAALSACLLARGAQGLRHVVAVRPLYGCSDHLLDTGLLGTEVTWVDPAGIADAIRPDTGLVMVETPANPTLAELDLRAVAHSCGTVPLLADNTFATPVLQRPAERGARLVLHSATKYLGGHGDVMGGVVACDEEFARVLRQVRFATGGVLHPLAGYLLLRGLATLPVRMRAASATAAELARRLAGDPRVARVHYPRIGGAMVAFEPHGDPHAVIGGVRLITPAVSLGSVDTLIQHPASISHRIVAEGDRRSSGIGDRLLRMSIGLEDVTDLWRDLDRALGPF